MRVFESRSSAMCCAILFHGIFHPTIDMSHLQYQQCWYSASLCLSSCLICLFDWFPPFHCSKLQAKHLLRSCFCQWTSCCCRCFTTSTTAASTLHIHRSSYMLLEVPFSWPFACNKGRNGAESPWRQQARSIRIRKSVLIDSVENISSTKFV